MIFDRGAEAASLALSKWLGQRSAWRSATSRARAGTGRRAARPARNPGRRLLDGADRPADRLDPAGLRGPSGLALVDLLLHQPLGTTATWGELEQSAAKETTNIVGCAYVNALAAHLPGVTPAPEDPAQLRPAAEEDPAQLETEARGELVPTPPTFLHEFAGSLLEFALMEQALGAGPGAVDPQRV